MYEPLSLEEEKQLAELLWQKLAYDCVKNNDTSLANSIAVISNTIPNIIIANVAKEKMGIELLVKFSIDEIKPDMSAYLIKMDAWYRDSEEGQKLYKTRHPSL